SRPKACVSAQWAWSLARRFPLERRRGRPVLPDAGRSSGPPATWRPSPGHCGEDGRGSLQDLKIFAEPVILSAQLRQLTLVRAGYPAVLAASDILPGRADPRRDRRTGQDEFPRYVARRPVATSAQLSDLGPESHCRRPAAPTLVPYPEIGRLHR